jgi:ribitol 2-dehydrogenase
MADRGKTCASARNETVSNSLEGKVVIITGASSGIGEATARTLAAAGAKLGLGARSGEKLEVLADELGRDRALPVVTDVTVGSQVTNLFNSTLEKFGRVDALFANAGVYVPGDVAEGDPDEWANMIDVNVNGVLRIVRAVLPHMLERGSGDIIVNSSVSGHQAIHWEPVYSASKHALQAFVHGLRRQMTGKGVRVGAIAPGVVLNNIWKVMDPEEIERCVIEKTGIRSEDVADLVAMMLELPAHINIRDLVVLPQAQEI